jgi:hypothetical protein
LNDATDLNNCTNDLKKKVDNEGYEYKKTISGCFFIHDPILSDALCYA